VAISESALVVRTRRFDVPARESILIEGSVILDHTGIADADFASGHDSRIGCPNCFVIVPRL
jgi:hypothetical protein